LLIVLFRQRVLEGVADKTISLAFRRWDRPRVKPGTLIRTRIGVIRIGSVNKVDPDSITDVDARAAGYRDASELVAELDKRGGGSVYCVHMSLQGPDPRVALRDDAALSQEAVQAISASLERMDRARRSGPWTLTVLRMIQEQPAVRAPDLAAQLGREKRPFKADVRKLKELGLTESLDVGYRLSPRGKAFLASVEQ
jgi:hypothetical protein